MDKLIKSIPDEHMEVLAAKAEVKGMSTSAHIRGLIKEDAGVMDIVIKGLTYASALQLKRNAAARGLTLNEYLFSIIIEEVK